MGDRLPAFRWLSTTVLLPPLPLLKDEGTPIDPQPP